MTVPLTRATTGSSLFLDGLLLGLRRDRRDEEAGEKKGDQRAVNHREDPLFAGCNRGAVIRGICCAELLWAP
jgi:hypothetical protein